MYQVILKGSRRSRGGEEEEEKRRIIKKELKENQFSLTPCTLKKFVPKIKELSEQITWKMKHDITNKQDRNLKFVIGINKTDDVCGDMFNREKDMRGGRLDTKLDVNMVEMSDKNLILFGWTRSKNKNISSKYLERYHLHLIRRSFEEWKMQGLMGNYCALTFWLTHSLAVGQ